MNEDRRKVLKTAQINALLNKLREGFPLTVAQLAYVESTFPALDGGIKDVPDAPEQANDMVSTANELANRLGVHRQTIAYHRGRAGAPPELSVSRWREYLAVMGKLPTTIHMQAADSKEESQFECDTAFAVLFSKLSDALPSGVRLALIASGIKATPRRVDNAVFKAWMILAATYHLLAKKHGVQGPFDPVDEGGKCEYPEEIKKLAARIAMPLPAKVAAVTPEGPAAKS